ncbi:MAG: hypothetical protein WEE64_04850 [Dehalococcoidia bacterium]
MSYQRPTKLTQWTNRLLGGLAVLGLTPSDTVMLEVRGRRSGIFGAFITKAAPLQ